MRSIEERARAAAEKWYNESDDRIGVEGFIAAEFADLSDAERRLEAVRKWAEGNLRHEFHPSGLLAILDGKEGA